MLVSFRPSKENGWIYRPMHITLCTLTETAETFLCKEAKFAIYRRVDLRGTKKMARFRKIEHTFFENLNNTFIRLRRLSGWRWNYFQLQRERWKKKCCLIFQKLQPCTKWRKTIIINVIFITKYDVKKKIHFLGENVFINEKEKEKSTKLWLPKPRFFMFSEANSWQSMRSVSSIQF